MADSVPGVEEATQARGRAALAGIKIIDVDTHLSEPHDLWTSRAPAAWRDRVPQVRDVNGAATWVIDGQAFSKTGSRSVIRKDGSKSYGVDFLNFDYGDIDPGSYALEARLAAMDAQGIWAQIVYPNLLGFGGEKSAKLDPQLRLVCTQIYNDAMAEMQDRSGGRLYPMPLLPWWDLEATVAETRRIHAMGLRGVIMNSDPHESGLPDLGTAYWDPLWETCCELSLPVNFHIGGSETATSWYGSSPWPSHGPQQRLAIGSVMLFVGNIRVFTNIVYSGLLERFPQLRFVSVESGIGWVPYILECLDYQLSETAPETMNRLSMKPSDYFRRQIWNCFWFERGDLAASIRSVGIDRVMFETDYPHPTCLYPDALDHAADALSSFTDGERRKILSGNAAELYGIEVR